MRIPALAASLTAVLAVPAAVVVTAGSDPVPAGPPARYLVLAADGADPGDVVRTVEAEGATVTARNDDVGVLSVVSTDADFVLNASRLPGVSGAARDRPIGRVDAAPAAVGPVPAGVPLRPVRAAVAPRTDPLDDRLWGMRMVRADLAHRIRIGTHRVRVAVIDTGIQASHPDLRPNVDTTLSRNFVTDIPAIDGPCEYASCRDPRGVDHAGHGTHVAGIIAAALNGTGISGVAPGVRLINLRAGQDSGYFFLQPVIDALTFAANHGVDVANLSFYVDPWLFVCRGGAPGDSVSEGIEQTTILNAMNKALAFAREKGVTLVASAGNEHNNLSAPRADDSSPNYPPGGAHTRPIDNANCRELPVEAANVIGVTALGPSGRKADYSNWATVLTSGEIDVSAPGGWYRDGFGTSSYRSNGNQILSTFPRNVLREHGLVDGAGRVTLSGRAAGVIRRCPSKRAPGAAACGYYAYLQGTSMAAPHVSGVAALAVARYGLIRPGGFGLATKRTRSIVYSTARDHACPPGGKQSYLREGRGSAWTATCVGTAKRNGFYGWGIVNAYAVVRK